MRRLTISLGWALSLFLAVFTTFETSAQIELGSDKVDCKFELKQDGCDATIIVKVTIDEHWHINALTLPEGSFGFATHFIFPNSKDYKLVGKPTEPKPTEFYDELIDEAMAYHEGTVTFKQKIKILTDKDFTLSAGFEYQTCDENRCLPNFVQDFKLKVKGCSETSEVIDNASENNEAEQLESEEIHSAEELSKVDSTEAKNTNNTVKSGGAKKDSNDEKSLWTIFIISFISGFAALMTPCVFPMIPMTVSFFTKQSKTRAKGISNAIIYSISIIIIYILLGTVVTAIFGAEALNKMSTNPTFNIIFFIILVVFAVSFLGAFEIRLPSSWLNKADSKADKGGLVGIFFMALALALVSFSCTGPIVGSLIVEAAREGGIAPIVGMFGFSLALALPFGLFAAFPGWMNTLPKSGGWLNAVKVVLGLLELALAFKFLSNADLALQSHYLERELFLAIWIGIFGVMTMYLFGFIRMPHDSPLDKLSVGRAMLGTTSLIFVIYMIPGLWGAPLKLISAFPPPSNYAESPYGVGGSAGGGSSISGGEHVEGMHLGPQKIMVFDDYEKASSYAKEKNMPLFIDYTGFNCVNCRRMEESVWGEPGIIDILREDVVIVSLHQDDNRALPKSEQGSIDLGDGRKMSVTTIGDKWRAKQIKEHNTLTQPYYVFQGPDGEFLSNGPADYEHHKEPTVFRKWLEEGMDEFKKKYDNN